MRVTTKQFGGQVSRVVEFFVGLSAIAAGYLVFLLLFDHSKFFEVVILFFEVRN
ncbi:MAG: hypothetical protein O3C67_07525 [Cyanobacteria bacterium]|nr:hypothetical protein [Cyanobacteriota bacterium]MEB3267183.1 hypothetical protein [Leptolyngbya sp.]